MAEFINRLKTTDQDFAARLAKLLAWESVSDTAVDTAVRSIIDGVRGRGDEALLAYTQQFDGVEVTDAAALELDAPALLAASKAIDAREREALKIAVDRVRSFHERQREDSWSYTEANGTVLGQLVRPIDRVGIYVPGGKAAYPSTVIMTAIPAQVAGVEEIIMVTPTPNGQINNMVLAAAHAAGVTRVFRIGGAQAIAALAYGTATVPRVDKIVGPGNIYVATAKRHVFGQVGLDMVAGPSEILILCDGRTDPEWIAMDLFSQAEHDEAAQAVLISPDAKFIETVAAKLQAMLPTLEREAIVRESLRDRSMLIQVRDMDEALQLVNDIAPEHLELSVEDPESVLPSIKHAGAIFMGRHTPEALGDYCAGPSHVLPTSGTARFSSPLGVYDFQKRSSVIHCSTEGASELGRTASVLARSESLTAHARAAEMRIKKS